MNAGHGAMCGVVQRNHQEVRGPYYDRGQHRRRQHLDDVEEPRQLLHAKL
jgi:hypothetical protein